MTKGNIHSTESFGSVDGPGIRFIIFLQGCKMRCRYCHNPDTWRTDQGQQLSPEELLDKAERYRSYWGEQGGITVSGGEPLLQMDFLIELFEMAKSRGITTCLDTSAQPYSTDEPFATKFLRLMRSTDTVLLDIKHIDSAAHKSLTGWPNDNILDCARTLDSLSIPVWIRHVLVPGITDNDEQLSKLASFIKTLSNVRRIDVLPYHGMAAFKYDKLGLEYSLKDTPSPSAERVANAKRILNEALAHD